MPFTIPIPPAHNYKKQNKSHVLQVLNNLLNHFKQQVIIVVSRMTPARAATTRHHLPE
jgi:hypothetical protein